MNKLIRTSGILIPKSDPRTDEIKNVLTKRIFEFNGESKWVEFYENLDKHILVPRYFIEDDIIDQTIDGIDIEIESKITPRSNAQKKAIDLVSTQLNGVLKLETGRGKSVTAIAAICNIKKKTIIFVHKDSLIKNWTSEFILHTSLTEDDIGKLSTKNYKECLQKPIILCTPHVISIILKKDEITKMQFLDALQSSGIGMQIVDECHVGVGPEQFSKASLMINSRRNWGLSATPNRNDDCNDIIRYHLGEIVYIPPDDNETMDPIIYAVKFDHDVYSKHKRYIQYGGKFNTIKYTNMFKKSDIYKNNLKSLILDAYSKNRNILILGTTILPILELAEHCNIPKNDVGIFMAGAVTNKKYKPLLAKITDTTDLHAGFHEKRVVFSTYQMARDGNNRKNLDCLFMLTTTNNCEQAIGRILRQDINKKQPIVIDIVDTDGPLDKSKIPLFERYFQKRMELYKSKNWEVKIFNIKQGKLYGNQN